MQATRARREAAVQALAAARRAVASEVRSAFFDLQQADRVLETETSNVQAADEALDIAKSNFAAGLGTQLDILQATSDVTRTRTTRLSAIYLHNVALARLAHACASSAEALNFGSKIESAKKEKRRRGASCRCRASTGKVKSTMKQRFLFWELGLQRSPVLAFWLLFRTSSSCHHIGNGPANHTGKKPGHPGSEIRPGTSCGTTAGLSFRRLA